MTGVDQQERIKIEAGISFADKASNVKGHRKQR